MFKKIYYALIIMSMIGLSSCSLLTGMLGKSISPSGGGIANRAQFGAINKQAIISAESSTSNKVDSNTGIVGNGAQKIQTEGQTTIHNNPTLWDVLGPSLVWLLVGTLMGSIIGKFLMSSRRENNLLATLVKKGQGI